MSVNLHQLKLNFCNYYSICTQITSFVIVRSLLGSLFKCLILLGCSISNVVLSELQQPFIRYLNKNILFQRNSLVFLNYFSCFPQTWLLLKVLFWTIGFIKYNVSHRKWKYWKSVGHYSLDQKLFININIKYVIFLYLRAEKHVNEKWILFTNTI